MIISNSGKITISIQLEHIVEFYTNWIDDNTIEIKNPDNDNGEKKVIYI